jgi:hypothetical protein
MIGSMSRRDATPITDRHVETGHGRVTTRTIQVLPVWTPRHGRATSPSAPCTYSEREILVEHVDWIRRTALLAPLLAAISGCGEHASPSVADVTPIHRHAPDPNETFVLPYDRMTFESWGNLPPRSGEMAMLYGDLNKPGPYLVMMRWNPGWFSAPHTYATDRLSVVVFGTWWVNSGNDFTPREATPVEPGGYVKRVARTPHYDGVLPGHPDPAVIAIFGIGPVDMRLVDPTKPPWRQL